MVPKYVEVDLQPKRDTTLEEDLARGIDPRGPLGLFARDLSPDRATVLFPAHARSTGKRASAT